MYTIAAPTALKINGLGASPASNGMNAYPPSSRSLRRSPFSSIVALSHDLLDPSGSVTASPAAGACQVPRTNVAATASGARITRRPVPMLPMTSASWSAGTCRASDAAPKAAASIAAHLLIADLQPRPKAVTVDSPFPRLRLSKGHAMLDRRQFVGAMTLPLAGAALGAAPRLGAVSRAIRALQNYSRPPAEAAADEDLWFQVSQAFTIDRSIINLNNGGVSPSPAIVQDAMKKRLDFSNQTPPPISLWRILEPQKETVRERLARQWGVDPEEIAITRNASESLQICQLGIDMKPGDEILCCTQDYPRMLTTFRQRERREGLFVKPIKIPIPSEDTAALLKLYDEAITPKTRMILLSHVINITGQIMPVKEVVALARSKNGGIPVIVDGAHALAHFDFKISDLGCDYYGVSLHKWLFAPHGTGLLYVRRDKIKSLWPMQAAQEKQDDDIRKFEEIGTHPAAGFLAIAEALTFNQGIGFDRKEARLRYLRDHWAKRLLSHKSGRVKLHTSLKPQFSCGIATAQVEGLDSTKLSDWLLDKRKILTTAIGHAEFQGIRVTPSVYTILEELDRFCEAMEWAIEKGLSA